jgi:hypothetical protein
MGRLLTMLVAVAALAAPAALADQPAPHQNAAKLCKAQLEKMGARDFRSLWGTNKQGRSAFGNCVALTAQQLQENVESAEEQCRAERAKNADAFATRYGTGKHGKNAFGKCVSQTAAAESQAQQAETLKAAKACKAERARNAAAFRDKYGTKHSKRNAFARCVATMKAQ